MTLTKRKFLNLDLQLRHRKCAELLRTFYEQLLKQISLSPEQTAHYNTLLTWMKLHPITDFTPHTLSHRYHYHLESAGLRIKEHHLLPSIRTGERIPKLPFGPAAIYLDNVRSLYNVGSILRTCEALRIGSVHFSPKTPFIDNEKLVRTALGAAPLVPCHPNATLSTLPRPIIILDTSDDAIPVSQFIFPPQFTLVLGNEELGVSADSLALADYIIEVPLFGANNALNVACAFAIAAAEIRRQSSLL